MTGGRIRILPIVNVMVVDFADAVTQNIYLLN